MKYAGSGIGDPRSATIIARNYCHSWRRSQTGQVGVVDDGLRTISILNDDVRCFDWIGMGGFIGLTSN